MSMVSLDRMKRNIEVGQAPMWSSCFASLVKRVREDAFGEGQQ